MVEIWALYVGMVDMTKLKFLIVATLLLFVLVVIVAIVNRRPQLVGLTNALDRALIPLYGGLIVIGIIAVAMREWEPLIPSMWNVLNLMMAGLIAVKLKSLGLPIPNLPWIGGVSK